VPALNFGIDVANPNNFSFAPQEADGTFHGQFVGRYLHTRNTLKTNQINASYELNDNLTLRTGFSKRDNTWTNVEIGSGGNGLTLPAGVGMGDITRQIGGFGKGLDASGVPNAWAAVDLDKFLKVYNIECHCTEVPGSSYNYLNQANRGVDESIKALFLAADFKYDLFSIPLRGNVGVRHARTNVDSFAMLNANGVLEPARL
jgi:hypothetical protein